MKTKIRLLKRKSLKPKSTPLKPKRSFRSKLAIAVLSIIAATSLIVILLPYIPRIKYLIFKPKIDATVYIQAAEQTKQGSKVKTDPAKIGNRLVLPDIGVDTRIIDGKNLYVIGKNQGVWRESRNIDPSKDGNMVIAGHRFLYTAANGGWFYNLPELKIGQKLFVKWNDKVYSYEVYRTRSVQPTQVDIRDKDPGVPRKLTLYTCFPLGSTAKRFVVEAKQI